MGRLLYAWLMLIGPAALLLSGCSESLNAARLSHAVPVQGWKGITNLSRDGDFYFAGQPTSDGLRVARRRGVEVVVNIRGDREIAEAEFDESLLVDHLGMEYVRIPVTPDSFGLDDADALKDVLSMTQGPILIHCASSNRVGALWAAYLHRHRLVAIDDAIELGRSAGLRSGKLIAMVRGLLETQIELSP